MCSGKLPSLTPIHVKTTAAWEARTLELKLASAASSAASTPHGSSRIFSRGGSTKEGNSLSPVSSSTGKVMCVFHEFVGVYCVEL